MSDATQRPLYRVLAVDGGGIRGIIPAVFLAELEARTGKPVSCLFDMLAGTSTGGILTTCLATPSDDNRTPKFRAHDVLEMYAENAGEIFQTPTQWWKRVLSPLRKWWRPEYTKGGIDTVLNRRLGSAHLTDALVELLVTSYEIEKRRPYFFKTNKARKHAARNHYLRHVARATSAAPTYFPPARIPTVDASRIRFLIDGGVFANNPALCAYVEARKVLHDRAQSCRCKSSCSCQIPKNVLLVSIGTGGTNTPLCFEKAVKWGRMKWVRPALDVMMDGMSDAVDHQLEQVYESKNGCGAYYRFQIPLSESSDKLDRIDRCNIWALKREGKRLLETRSECFDRLVNTLNEQCFLTGQKGTVQRPVRQCGVERTGMRANGSE